MNFITQDRTDPIRRAMRRAILDNGRIEAASTNGTLPNTIRVYGLQDRLIDKFEPDDEEYDKAITFWQTHNTSRPLAAYQMRKNLA